MNERVTSSARSRAVASARRCSSRMAVNHRGHEGLEGAYNAGRTQMTGTQMRYAIVIEKAESNYAAYVPDLAGCVATGATVEETERSIREAIEIHVEGLRAERAKSEWKLAQLRVGYGVSPEDARKAGLYLSEEPDRRLYTEPGILAVKPEDGTLYAAWVQSTPHARPHFEEVLSAVENMLAKDLPKPKG